MDSLLKKIENKQKQSLEYNYAVFDFDNTCIVNDIGEAILHFLCRNNLLRDHNLLKDNYIDIYEYHQAVFTYYYKLLNNRLTEQAYILCAQCISGFSVDEIKNITKHAITYEGTIITKENIFGININKGLKKRDTLSKILEYSQKNNIDVFIVSSSPEYLVKIAFHLFYPKINATIIGIKNITKKSIITKELVYPLSILSGKVLNIKNNIHPSIKPLFAIGDSMNDFKMLEYSQLPIVVYQKNNLSNYAQKNNWDIIYDK